MSGDMERGRLRKLIHRLSILEPVAIFSLIILYIWWLRDGPWPSAWIAIMAVIVASHVLRGETLAGLGFQVDNFTGVLARFTPFLLLLALALLTAGMLFETIRRIPFDDGILNVLAYCVWGLFQQYLLDGYFVNRFAACFRAPNPHVVSALAAVCFSAAHVPNWFLMSITLAGGFVSAEIYLRWRNLYFLGLAHGIIGFLLHLVVPDSITNHFYVGPR